MEKADMAKGAFCSSLGLFGATFISLLGGWDEIIAALIVLMTVDFLSGISAAFIFKKSTKTQNGCLESKAMLKGLVRKGFSLSVVIVGTMLDRLAGTDFVRNAVVLGLCMGEILSLIENLALMGVEIPDAILNGLELFQNKKH